MSDIYNIQSPFIGDKVKLRALEVSDLDNIMRYFNNYETRVGLGNIIPISYKMEEDWINSAIERAKAGTAYIFVIEHKENGELLGTCGIEDISTISRSATLGIGIHNPENFNKGYGTDAMICLMKFGFRVLNLHRIELWTFDYNQRAIHVYKKLGWKEVGKRREVMFLQGKYHDAIVMDLLQNEFEDIYKEEIVS
ncbi:MAG: GNAT family N-acetyltransferase [Candidatus Heimdallarchaeota archaeon]|nr:GNAT family N-acetyltransferase [Candidatus Heimdallarchaeota archaeon]